MISHALGRFICACVLLVLYFKCVRVALFLRVLDGLTRRMVRTPKGTDFIGREKDYDDKLFVPVPVKKGEL